MLIFKKFCTRAPKDSDDKIIISFVGPSIRNALRRTKTKKIFMTLSLFMPFDKPKMLEKQTITKQSNKIINSVNEEL